jgi:hypothetical protein
MNFSVPLLWKIVTLVFYTLLSLKAVEAQSRVPLAEAVEEFNRMAIADPVGKSQPPLTVEEVLAAIQLMELRNVNLPQEGLAEYKLIGKEKSIESVDKIKFIASWGPLDIDGELYNFEVWWIDLRIQRDGIKDSFGRTPSNFNLRMRERTISSRKLTQSEVDAYEQMVIGSEINQRQQMHLELLKQKRDKK